MPEQKYDIDQSAKDEITFLKSEVERLNHWNAALNTRISEVCEHEILCRRQNLELWQENDILRNEISKLKQSV